MELDDLWREIRILQIQIAGIVACLQVMRPEGWGPGEGFRLLMSREFLERVEAIDATMQARGEE